MRRLGYPDAALVMVHEAYKVAIRLMGAYLRPTGKPFLCHLVGTASILAACRAETSVVVAGLLHAAYTHGHFDGLAGGGSGPKRRHIRRAVGSEVEKLVARYTEYTPASFAPATGRRTPRRLDKLDRQVILIRMANELEDRLDLGMLYCAKVDGDLEPWWAAFTRAAESARAKALLAELAVAVSEAASSTVPAALRATKDRSYVIQPAGAGSA
jgi:uncharacterized protein DUF6817